MSVVECRLEGDKNLVKWLDALEPKVRTRILRPAVTAAARPVRMAAKGTAPKDKGNLAGAIGLKTWAKRGTAVAFVGPRSDIKVASTNLFGQPITAKPGKYAHLVETGTRPHIIVFQSKSGRRWVWKHPGTKGTHFLERAFRSSSGKATSILNDRILAGIEKYA